MAAKKRGLGKGLDALLGTRSESSSSSTENDSLKMLAVDLIQRGQYQPRQDFDAKALDELADSIRAQGMVQPIVVRKLLGKDSYEIIAGERRWRAAQQAGLHEVPVVIKEVSDQTAMCMALIENIQRENLNPLEEAQALSRLIQEFGMTHEAIADSVGRSRSSVSNLIRLLELAEDVKALLVKGDLEMGHARALLTLSKSDQSHIAAQVAKRGLSVRETEALAKKILTGSSSKSKKKNVVDSNIKKLETELSERLGASVSIRPSTKEKGTLSIHYHSLDELDGIIKKIK